MTRRFIGLVVGALLWEVAGHLASPLTFAPLSRVLASLARMLLGAELWRALAVSLQSVVVGFALAVVAGLAIGFLSAWFEEFEQVSETYMTVLLAVPMAAVIPLVVMGLGLGLAARAAVVFLFAFPIIVVNTTAGVRGVEPALFEMARSYGAGPRAMVVRVMLPGAMPAILTGIRLGLGRALVGMITSELVLLSVGLGLLVDKYQSSFQVANLWAVLLVLLILGGSSLGAVQALERRMTHWRKQ